MLHKTTFEIVLACIFCVCCLSTTLDGQDAAFTYQGELSANGSPANGAFDMTFSLWNAIVGGTQIDTDHVLNGVSVVDGKFSVALDFGAASFNNSSRWLEIEVNGSTLFPRNQITRSPYSVQTRGIYVDPLERVGIGTTNPQTQLDLESATGSALRLTTTDNNPTTLSKLQLKSFDSPGAFHPLGRIEFVDQTDTLKSFIQGTKGPGGSALMDLSVTPGDLPQISIDSDNVDLNTNVNVEGDLGIGIAMPEGPLHVQAGSAGILTALPNSSAVFERSGQNFISILSPNASERGILFGDPESIVNGGIAYNSTATPDGFQFRTGGNQSKMVITSAGNVGIGTNSPGTKLDVAGDSKFRNRLGVGDPGSFFGQLTINDSNDGSIFALDATSDNSIFPTIFAFNQGNGPILWANGISDVEPEGGGIIVVGSEDSNNIGIDRNEIMARNNGQPSTLYLNAEGGNVRMGSQQTTPAYAYGRINEAGVLTSGSANITNIAIDNNAFLVSFADGFRETDIAMATDGRPAAQTSGAPVIAATRRDGNRLRILTYDTVDLWSTVRAINFVVYRP